ncbi:XK-related protein 4 [Octopus bimaculoides]|uniref:XK-related protein 4 n=1 Tax=Octopus bimaculoides TaxID=37653 RepID=UPI00071CCD9E|nr:XK-related protein 4 [Octopus bimaculoides]|eukprot:XP_014778597.1 PREDICTED: XK-related protein 4-like [Octopus bimaculoides]
MACPCSFCLSTARQTKYERAPNKTDKNLEDPSMFDQIFILLTMILILVDVSSDLVLAFSYLNRSHYVWFGLTLAFVLVPSVSNSILSLYFYYHDYKEEQQFKSKDPNFRSSSTLWILRIVFTILQMAPIVRNLETFRYGIKSKTTQSKDDHIYYNKWMLRESADARMLGLFECFMESAPQLTLQLHILVVDPTTTLGPLKIINLLSSWITISWSLTSYHRALRFVLKDKSLSLCASVTYFMWRIFEVGPRIIIISMFMTEYYYWVAVLLSLHWILVFSWFQFGELKFCETAIGQTLFNMLLAFISIFCSFDPHSGKSRYRYLLFYAIFYGQNIILFTLWFCFTNHKGTWYHLAVLLFVLCGAILHTIFFGCYYVCCHPICSSFIDWHKILPTSCRQFLKTLTNNIENGV